MTKANKPINSDSRKLRSFVAPFSAADMGSVDCLPPE